MLAYSYYTVSNTPGNPGNLLEIYKVSWKFSGLVRAFVVNISYNSCISECIGTKYFAVNQDQLIFRLVIPGKCRLSVYWKLCLLIR